MKEDIFKDSIKRFITCAVPINTCNFHCQYCYLRAQKQIQAGFYKFILPPEQLVLHLTKKRLGGTCYFNFCGDGETLLHPQIVEMVSLLTKEGHFCDIITNGTISKRFDELTHVLSNNQKERVLIKFSFHWRELLRTGLLFEFTNNVEKCRKAGFSYTIEITPEDELIPYLDIIEEYSVKNFGALPHITVARNNSEPDLPLLTKLNKVKYMETWGRFNSELFNFKMKHFGIKQNKFCYAGEWSLCINLKTGIYRQCYDGCNLGNITEAGPLHLKPVGRCASPHCFNCHAFLTLGTIPELKTASYFEMRDRITTEGDHWINNRGRNFFSTRLQDNNQLMSVPQKYLIYYFKGFPISFCHTLKRSIIKLIRNH